MPQIMNMSEFRIYFEFLIFLNFFFNLGILLKTKINHTLIWVHVTFEEVFISGISLLRVTFPIHNCLPFPFNS